MIIFLNSNLSQNLVKRLKRTTKWFKANFTKTNLLRNIFTIPPLPEQQKIASILSNVDNLIQKTDQIIEQTQRLKKGLMQKLLTKGIGHTKFKKTDLGEIPEEWPIVKLKDIVSSYKNGIYKKSSYYGVVVF